MFYIAWIEWINGGIQTLSSVESDGVLVPRADNANATM